jgi:beta-glucanase (GH16 family)
MLMSKPQDQTHCKSRLGNEKSLAAKALLMGILALPLMAMLPLQSVAAPPSDNWVMVWNDEFQGNTLDGSKWSHWQPGPRRQAVNTSESVSVTNGALVITTFTREGRHFSGMVSSEGRFNMKYGYIEARIAFQGAPGAWSSFWLQSPTIGEPPGDPATAGMEIDIAEHRFVDERANRIDQTISHNIHWDGYGAQHKSASKNSPGLGLAEGYHVYALEWTPECYRFYVDGVLDWQFEGQISRREQYILLSSEAEGGNWAGNIPQDGFGAAADSAMTMRVDYVRVYVSATAYASRLSPVVLAWNRATDGHSAANSLFSANNVARVASGMMGSPIAPFAVLTLETEFVSRNPVAPFPWFKAVEQLWPHWPDASRFRSLSFMDRDRPGLMTE